MLAFGTDGYLYIAFGTGGTAISLQHNAQDLGSLLGKILRVDVDGGNPYAIPPDNPFVNQPGARGEVWAYGLRNPWRFAFDRATNDLYIGGPGQFTREWINFQPAGASGTNFGWPMFEGTICWENWVGPCDPAGLSLPIVEYNTYSNGGCVIIGGYVYRGTAYALLQGAYLFTDFCSGRISTTARDASGTWVTTELLDTNLMISSFGEDETGELYVTDINGGGVYRVVASAR
jgi:glucose/arabinose dehydrogenase